MPFRSLLFSALVVAAALGAACDVHVGENGVSLDVASGRASDEWTRTYKLSPKGTIEIVNVNGAIVVEGTTVTASSGMQTVTVRAERKVRAGSDEEAKDALQKLQMTEEVMPDHVKVQSPGGRPDGFRRPNVSIDYRVTVPAGLTVVVKTQNGGIRLQGVNGPMNASTTNGGVRGSNLAGAVSAHTVNGGIQLDLSRVSGTVQVDAVNGGVRLDLPADTKADLDARVVNGGVSVDPGIPLSAADRQRNSVTGTLNGGGVKISASTVNGGVRIGVHSDGAPANTSEDDDDVGVTVRRKSQRP